MLGLLLCLGRTLAIAFPLDGRGDALGCLLAAQGAGGSLKSELPREMGTWPVFPYFQGWETCQKIFEKLWK